jgi:hypothetical protein
MDFLIVMITMSIQVLFTPIFSVAIWIVTLEPQGDNIGRRRHCAEFWQTSGFHNFVKWQK